MAKPKFDPSQPFEVAAATASAVPSGSKPKFDPSKPFEVGDESAPARGDDSGGVLGVLSTIAKTVDSYTGAPTRAAIGAVQEGKNPISAFGKQFGEDPERAPTGRDIVRKAGVSDRPVYDTSDDQFEYLQMQDPRMAAQIGGLRDVTRSGTAGLAVDMAADPLNFIPVGKVAEGVGKGARALSEATRLDRAAGAARKALGEGAKYVAETAAFKATGPMLKDMRVAVDKGTERALGRFALDNKIVDKFDDVEKIAAKAEAKRAQVGERLENAYAKAEKEFGDRITKVGFDPKRDRAEVLAAARKELGNAKGADAAVEQLGKYIDEIAARHGDGPMEKATRAYKEDVFKYKKDFRNFLREKADYQDALGKAGEDLNQGVLFKIDDGQRTTPKKVTVEVNGKDRSVLRPQAARPMEQQSFLPDLPTGESEVNRLFATPSDPFGERYGTRVGDQLAADAQKQFLDQNTAEQIALLSRQGEIEGDQIVPRMFREAEVSGVTQSRQPRFVGSAPEVPVRPTRPEDIRNPMRPSVANDVKTEMDRAINYSRNPNQPDPVGERAFSAARGVVAKKVDEAFANLGGDALAQELRAANREYGQAKTLASISSDRVARDKARMAYGLTENMAGQAGAAASAVLGPAAAIGNAVATATGAKLIRKYGSSTIAAYADQISKRLLANPEMLALAKSEPQKYQVLVLNMTRRVIEGPSEAAASAASTNELDRDSSVPASYKVLPDGARNDRPLKGRDKWASDGLEKLATHIGDDGTGQLSQMRDELMSNAKTKELLVSASKLKPGSKFFDSILTRLQSEVEKASS